ncbi:MAG: T9SS type A sorting domain-containing protein [Aureispira sp.]|nr:T9SS type A sorting domain-containing protein [Aureispira sp.]
MIKNITLLFSLLFVIAWNATLNAQCTNRYKERVFSSSQFYGDIDYTRSPKMIASVLGVETNINKTLGMDIYMPPPIDNAVKRPLVILAHGGGFVDVAFMGWTPLVGTKDNDDMQDLADTMAHRGFVAASIEYRVGFDPLSEKSMRRAVWRAAQDMSAAIRFFRENAAWFNIDPDRIFIGGSSAGAFTCLHTAFIDDSERIPESYRQDNILGWQIAPDLGELHSRPVERLTGFNPFSSYAVPAANHSGVPNGVVSFWGAMGDPNWVAGTNQAPTIMFHGTNDWVVPVDEGKPFNGLIPGAPVTYGTQVIDTAMTNQGVMHETYLEPGQPHEYWGVLNGNWPPFGGPNFYWQPMIQKTSDFFYKVMQPAAPVLTGVATPTAYTLEQYEVPNPDPNAEYCWEVDGGSIVSPTTNGSIIRVYWWNQPNGSVSVRSMDDAFVISETAELAININTVPIAPQKSSSNSSTLTQVGVSESSIGLAPNPADNELNLIMEEVEEGTYTISVVDMMGRQVKQTVWAASGFENKVRLDVANLVPGTYVVQLVGENSRVSKRFVKR